MGSSVTVMQGSSELSKLPERYATKIRIDENGCWIWTAALNPNGYGIALPEPGESQLAHRAIYERLRGKIPKPLVPDPLCRVRNCVNPDHLEIVTEQVNILRGVGRGAKHAAKTHCIRGHLLGGDNVSPTGKPHWRRCKQCRRIIERVSIMDPDRKASFLARRRVYIKQYLAKKRAAKAEQT